MNDKQHESPEPAAYDSEGRPLYYQNPNLPPSPQPKDSLVMSKPESYDGHNFNPQLRTQHAAEQDLVHVSRPVEPAVPEISESLRKKHDDSMSKYPFLNLSEGECVVLQISRHPIGLLIPIFFTSLAVIILTTMLLLIPDLFSRVEYSGSSDVQILVVGIIVLLLFLSIFIGGAAVWIYQKNQFFLTNESVIQEIQHSLFSHHEQTVSLGSIEDASFKRQGILQHLFNYGTMRLSTEGEETTYRFAFVENPKEQIAIVNNAVEAFKNGRPVTD